MEQEKIDIAKCLANLKEAFWDKGESCQISIRTLENEWNKSEEKYIKELIADNVFLASLMKAIMNCINAVYSFKSQRIIDNINDKRIFDSTSLSKYCKAVGIRLVIGETTRGEEGVIAEIIDRHKFKISAVQDNLNYCCGSDFTMSDVIIFYEKCLKETSWKSKELLDLIPVKFYYDGQGNPLYRFIEAIRNSYNFKVIELFEEIDSDKQTISIKYDFR